MNIKDFKTAIKASVIAFVVALVAVIGIGTMIYFEKIPDRKKIARIEMAGAGIGVMTAIAVAPFWLAAAARVRKRRRSEQEAQRPK